MPTKTHLSPRGRLYRNQPQNWLFPETMAGFEINKVDAFNEPADEREIDAARENIRQQFLKYPGFKCEIAFSGGKDSLLTALLAFEVASDLGRVNDVHCLTTITGYESHNGETQKEVLRQISHKIPVEIRSPAPWRSYSVEVLGAGVQPLTLYGFKRCEQVWKGSAQGAKPGQFKFGGSRRYESITRYTNYKERTATQEIYPRSTTPILDVHTKTVWDYLERNLKTIGVDYDYLKNVVYARTVRDGCWCCIASKPDEHTPLQQYIIDRSFYWWNWYQQNRRWLYEYFGLPFPRATLKYKRIMFDEVIKAQERLGDVLLTPLHAGIIHDLWKWQETYREYKTDDFEGDWTNKITVTKLKEKYNDYIQKALYPKLWEKAFKWVRTQNGTLRGSLISRYDAGAYKGGIYYATPIATENDLV